MTAQFPSAVPEIPVRDVVTAAAYYQRCLGFTVDWCDEELGLAGISRGDCRMFLASAHYRAGYANAGPSLTWLNLDGRTPVDELHRAWSTGGATIVSAPASKPWGLHEFTAADPDGNFLRVFYDFATPDREAGA